MTTQANAGSGVTGALGLPETFTVCVKMIGDWHVGSGAGIPGSLDRIVIKDADDLPFIPAKTLTGIWRDSCEQLALGLDDGNPQGPWSSVVRVVFGVQSNNTERELESAQATPLGLVDPQAAVLSIRAARVQGRLRTLLAQQAAGAARAAMTFTKPGIAIDRQTGQAKEDFLRFEEMARGGLTLEAECSLPMDALDLALRPHAEALLAGGLKMAERLGGKRRRGAGRCLMWIKGYGDKQQLGEVIALLETVAPPVAQAAPAAAGQTRQHVESKGLSSDKEQPFVSIPLRIKLNTAVVIPARTVGNVVETLDHVPGTYFLPLLHKVLAAGGIDARAAILSGRVMALPATPEINGCRGEPAPMALAHRKGKAGFPSPSRPDRGGDIFNLMNTDVTEPHKQYRQGYVAPAGAKELWWYDRPVLTVGTHNTVEDKSQRPTAEVGGVYSYQALAAGQVFRSEIRIAQELHDRLAALQPGWWKKFNRDMALGRAKKDDYGAVAVEVAGEPQAVAGDPARPTGENGTLRVWLLSDAILHDARLGLSPTPEQLAATLGEELGVKLKLTANSFTRCNRLESWQRRWQLPRPSLLTLAAGSCLELEVVSELKAKALNRVEATGIGSRRAEGYGQVCFERELIRAGLGTYAMPKAASGASSEEAPKEAQPLREGEPGYDYAALIEREAWRAAIRRAVIAIAADEDGRKKALKLCYTRNNGTWESKPPMSQLGALRGIIGRLRTPNESEVMHWLDHLKDTDNRSSKWGEALAQVRNLVSNRLVIWNLLELEQLPLLTVNGRGRMQQELWAEAVQTLVDEVVRAHKRELEQKGGRHG